MSEDSTDTPSQHEANKVLRVLVGERLKFTVRVHKANGDIVELQSNSPLKLDWNAEARCLWLEQTLEGYTSAPCCPYEVGMFIHHEENPK